MAMPTSSFVPSEMPSNEINIYLMHHIDLCGTSELMLHIVALDENIEHEQV